MKNKSESLIVTLNSIKSGVEQSLYSETEINQLFEEIDALGRRFVREPLKAPEQAHKCDIPNARASLFSDILKNKKKGKSELSLNIPENKKIIASCDNIARNKGINVSESSIPCSSIPLPLFCPSKRNDSFPNHCCPTRISTVKLKKLQWKPLSYQDINSEPVNIWKNCQVPKTLEIDFDNLDILFEIRPILKICSISASSIDKSLIDPKKLFSMSIALKNIKRSPEEICELIKNQDVVTLTIDCLKQIHRSLPSNTDEKLIENLDHGSTDNLAERFIFLLHQIPNYRLIIKSMIFSEEFQPTYRIIKKPTKKIIKACKTIINSKSLVLFMQIILTCGNYMNRGSHIGNVFGVEFDYLHFCLITLKGKSSRLNLLMFILLNMKVNYPNEYYNLRTELLVVEDAIKTNIREILEEMAILEQTYKDLSQSINLVKDETAKDKLQNIIEAIIPKMNKLKSIFIDMNSLLDQLGLYFHISGANLVKFDILHLLYEFNRDILYSESIKPQVYT